MRGRPSHVTLPTFETPKRWFAIAKHRLAFLAIIGLTACHGVPMPTNVGRPQPFEDPDARLADELDEKSKSAGGVLGVAYRVLDVGGPRGGLRDNEAFPMASVYKLPIALTLLHEVDEGKLALDTPVNIVAESRRAGRSDIAETLPPEGRTMKVSELLEEMMASSDNTASDALLALAGGPSSVTNHLRSLGTRDVRVDRSELEMFHDFVKPARRRLGIDAPKYDDFGKLEDALTDEEIAAATKTIASDPRDSATPDALVWLLTVLHEGKALKPASTKLLLEVMSRAKPDRLSTLLPPNTLVAHKTGTTIGAVNDVGLVKLPDGRFLAIVVFLKGSSSDMETGERAIAEVSRMVYDRVVSGNAP